MKAAAALAVVVVASLLAGCSNKERQLLCPGMAALTETAYEPVFRSGTTPDPANVLYTVQVVGVSGTCDTDKLAHSADASIEIHFRATRAPTGESVQYAVPYLVTVTSGDRILNRQNFQTQVTFQPGESSVDFTDTVASTKIQAEKDKHPWDYQILVSLPLSKEQLDYNRTIGRFVQ